MIAGDRLLPGVYNHFAGFTRVDNYADAHGNIVAISDDVSLLHANTIILNNYEPGVIKRLEISVHSIMLDHEVYRRYKDQIFCSDFSFPAMDLQTVQNKIKLFLNQNKNELPQNSLLFLLNPEIKTDPFSSFDKLLQQEFEKAFSFFDDDFFESIRKFRSKGKGLTPAGDDFIAGVLYGIDCLASVMKSDYSDLKNQIDEIAKTDNLFSQNMLHLAKEGRYFKRLQDFLNTFFNQGSISALPPFQQLISTGDTSGADLISGFFAILLHKPCIFENQAN
ncbi:MAG: DUF2877 domain-containing protein [Bacteroidia bacterium]|nr:MAG: DUF2877 domain-containing protein [Bacteroidia bacterium]